MFETKKFLQILGISILITVITSIAMGLGRIENYLLFLIIQWLITYGSLGVLSAIWMSKTPYFSAYLGAVVISLLNILFSYFVFNIMVFVDPNGIYRSLSWAVILALTASFITKFLVSRTKVQTQ